MAVWRYVLATPTGAPLVELPATSRSVAWHLDDPAEASFTVDGLDPRTSQIEELISDLLIYRDRRLMFRGRILDSDDNADGDSHETTIRAVDYRGLLDRRFTWAGLGWSLTDQSQIAWNLIDHTQGQTGGSWGITRGLGQTTGTIKSRLWEWNSNIGTLIADLARSENGFDWEVDADLAFNVWPKRGATKEWVAEYGNTVQSFRRAVSSDSYANAWRASGDDTINPVGVVAADIASRPEGRWERLVGDSEITQTAALTELANGELARSQIILPTYVCNVDPAKWVPEDAWVGDSTTLVLYSGRVQAGLVERIESVAVSVDDTGSESVTLTYGQRRREAELYLLRFFGLRLSNLERY